MELAPTIDHVQNVIDGSWKRAGLNGASSPRVQQTLVFFTPDEECESFAIVDTHGGNIFHVGAWKVATLSCKAPQAIDFMECRIGETAVFGPRILLLLARNGGQLPPLASCRSAVACQENVRKHSRMLVAELDETRHLLAKHRARLEQDRKRFARYPELSRASEIVATEIEAVQALEDNLAKLLDLPSRRSLVDLVSEIEREAAELHSFREDVQEIVARQAETLKDHRERYDELERFRHRDEMLVRDERERVERLYQAALTSPTSLTYDEALAELQDIVKLADIDDSDRFILRRRLYILRIRCRHSLTSPNELGVLRTLLADIEEEIHLLKRRG